jgi:hypothetical protein
VARRAPTGGGGGFRALRRIPSARLTCNSPTIARRGRRPGLAPETSRELRPLRRVCRRCLRASVNRSTSSPGRRRVRNAGWRDEARYEDVGTSHRGADHEETRGGCSPSRCGSCRFRLGTKERRLRAGRWPAHPVIPGPPGLSARSRTRRRASADQPRTPSDGRRGGSGRRGRSHPRASAPLRRPSPRAPWRGAPPRRVP